MDKKPITYHNFLEQIIWLAIKLLPSFSFGHSTIKSLVLTTEIYKVKTGGYSVIFGR